MDPFWNNIYDDGKDKRYSGLFIGVLLFLLVGLPLAGLLLNNISDIVPNCLNDLIGYPDVSRFQIVCLTLASSLSLVAIGLFGLRWARVGRKERQDRLKNSNLSRDELMKARSKLKNNMNPVKFRAVERPAKRPALRAPDTDLKY
ncbi:MAG TPA: hypothetical protein VMF08_03010 [Candidatus Sulfotelmatobacter sp.]|nr:hypothetical protein [Candidatus Sulfotelmatobacter sp.]